MPQDLKRKCPVCGQLGSIGLICTRCKARLSNQGKMHRSAWMMVSAAILFLVALALWSHQLGKQLPTQEDGGKTALGPIPDAGPQAAPAVAVAYLGETCVPWHVSAASKPPPKELSYLILNSRLVDPYGLVLAGFADECPGHVASLLIENLAPGDLARTITETKPAALVAVGKAAAARIQAEASGQTLLFAAIIDPVGTGLNQAGFAGVSPWLPPQAMVRHWLDILPRKRDLALIYPAASMAETARLTAAAMSAQKRKLSLFPVKSTDDLPAILEQAGQVAGAWIVLADKKILGTKTFNQIQLAAEAKAIPVAVSDEEHVRRGALVGVGADSHRVGAQVCRLAGALARGELPADSHVFCPEYSFAVVNITVAEKLGYVYDFSNLKQAKIYKWH